jgi:Protein of unknown function (DUF4058)
MEVGYMEQSPFPGMDPYLEAPNIWPDLHGSLPAIFREQLNPQLIPRYLAEIGTEIVIDYLDDDLEPESRVAVPDLSMTHTSSYNTGVMVTEAPLHAPLRLQVPLPVERRLTSVRIIRRDLDKLVAVIELLSPINKRPGPKRQEYLAKRRKYLESRVHLIEVDLLRKWRRMPLEGELPASDYLVVVSNFYERPDADVWPLSIRQPLPVIPVPLLRPDPPAMLDLGEALRTAYARARYDLRIHYEQPPNPPLNPEDAVWAAELILTQAD